ncbi:MAG: nickel pincer cofactor biosynthesis protein LarB [Deltaproteobacteria bacterium]|nr:nickel pincer cofactor biosynthesis protein LarB [Deltaproteobacteria bacterium]
MKEKDLERIIEKLKTDRLSVADAAKAIDCLYFADIGHSVIDVHREARTGYHEVIYCSGKTPEQVGDIAARMIAEGHNVLATRANKETYLHVRELVKSSHMKQYMPAGGPENAGSALRYDELGKTLIVALHEIPKTESAIVIITAGTSDLPVALEAYNTAEFFGNRVQLISDVGVAGIHRLFHRMDAIDSAKVIIVVAGMEGALASVVGGMVKKPIIAVPTSVGYGANFHGLATLLAMLNSCAPGVSVVNIDNGFGAAYCASVINKL